MNLQTRKILFINLDSNKSEVKSFEDYGRYIGGVGLGAKVLNDLKKDDGVVFSVGPLTGFFPCASKTSVLFQHKGEIKDLYLGGNLASRIKFTGLDAIAIFGQSEKAVNLEIIDGEVSFKFELEEKFEYLGLPGKRSTLSLEENNIYLDQYFESPSRSLYEEFKEKNLNSLSVTGTKTFEIEKEKKYKELFNNLLERCKDLDQEETKGPSCYGCPIGCGHSKIGEEDGDVFIHSLVACDYTQEIYSDVSTVFSCLDVLGYKHVHEDLENFPNVVYDLLEELNSDE